MATTITFDRGIQIGILFAYIATVGALIWQIQSFKKSLDSNTYNAMICQTFDVLRLLHDDPEIITEFWPITIKDIDSRRLPAVMMMFNYFENLYFQHEKKIISNEMWVSWCFHIQSLFLNSDLLKETWKLPYVHDAYYSHFQDFIDELLERTEGNQGNE